MGIIIALLCKKIFYVLSIKILNISDSALLKDRKIFFDFVA